MGVFAIAALILAAIGTYGVMAYGARLRSRELGLRVALGASRGGVIGLMLRQNLWSSALGVACGLALGYGLSYPLAPMLPEVSNTEPLIYLVVASVLLAAALLACWLPARRAAAIAAATQAGDRRMLAFVTLALANGRRFVQMAGAGFPRQFECLADGQQFGILGRPRADALGLEEGPEVRGFDVLANGFGLGTLAERF
mgnify:CR=1 FL=1